jgi:hypothetical protein
LQRDLKEIARQDNRGRHAGAIGTGSVGDDQSKQQSGSGTFANDPQRGSDSGRKTGGLREKSLPIKLVSQEPANLNVAMKTPMSTNPIPIRRSAWDTLLRASAGAF